MLRFIVPFLVVFPCFVQAYVLEHERISLKNGMQAYIIKTDSPIITHVIGYKVGALMDPAHKQGIANMMRHLMFSGSKKYSKDMLQKRMQQIGASYGTFVSHDLSMYYISAPAMHLEEIIEIESHRMRNLLFTKQQLDIARSISDDEQIMNSSNKYNMLLTYMEKYAFSHTNYGYSVLGYTKWLDSITLEDVSRFYHYWYQPNYAAVFIIGNVDLNKASLWIKKYYGDIVRSPYYTNDTHYYEPKWELTADILLHDLELTTNHVVLSYLVPSFSSDSYDKKKFASLVILRNLLNSHEGQLFQNLVLNKQLCTDISVSYDYYRKGHTLFMINATTHKETESILDEIKLELKSIIINKFNKQKFDTIARSLNDSMEYNKEYQEAYIIDLAKLALTDVDIDDLHIVGDKFNSVTIDDVIAVLDELTSQHYIAIRYEKKKQ